MRRFRFRLDPLLRVRAQIERLSRRELAASIADANVLDQRLAAAAQGLRDCADQARDTGAVGKLARSLEAGLRRHEWRLRNDRNKAQARVDAARAEHVGKARDLRTLERLREKRHTEWRTAVAAAEQMELDELARIARAAMRAAEDGGNEA